jgi:hypothetical protein
MADIPRNKTLIVLAVIAAVVVLLGGYEAAARWLDLVPSLLTLIGP